MKVLLTGGGGFMGHHILSYFLKNTDYEFILTDSFNHVGISARLRAVFDEIPEHRKRVKIITHDLSTPIDKITRSEIGNIDIIINTASLANVDDSIYDPKPFIQNNINIALNMFEYARNIDTLKTFIHISTDEVYGDATNHLEWDPQVPSNPYSASKASQEAIAQAYWRTYDLPIIITNTTNMFGERQDSKAFIPKAIGCILNDTVLPIHSKIIDGKKMVSSRYYLYTQNQADAIKFLIEKFYNSPHRFSDSLNRIMKFNVAGDIDMNNDDVAFEIGKILNKKPILHYVNPTDHRPGLDLKYGLNGDKLKSLGWKQPFTFNKSLEKTVLWAKDNKIWL